MKEINVQVNNECGKKPSRNSEGQIFTVGEGCEIKLIIRRDNFSRLKIIGTNPDGNFFFKDECNEVDFLVRDSGIHDRLAPLEDQFWDTMKRMEKCEIIGDEIQASQLRYLAKSLERTIKEIKDEGEL
jgi:hypothetical protein